MAKDSRYIKDIVLNLPSEEIESVIQEFLTKYNFYQTEWRGDICWSSGEELRFFQYSYSNDTLHIEAWVRNGKTGEMGLTGFAASDLKVPYLYTIRELLSMIIRHLPENSAQKQKLLEEYKADSRSFKKGIIVLVAAVLCFLCLWRLIFFIN